MSRLLAVLCCIVSCASISGAHDVFAQKADIEKPFVLVADPSLETPRLYKGSVILVAPREANGNTSHVGVMLNRPIKASLADLLPEQKTAKKVKGPVRYVGPVKDDLMVALVHAERSPDSLALPVASGLYLTDDEKTIDSAIESRPNDCLYFVGRVVWQPGELEEELKRGRWFVKKVTEETVFAKDAAGLWGKLVQSLLHKRDGI